MKKTLGGILAGFFCLSLDGLAAVENREDAFPPHVYFLNHVHSHYSKDNGWAKFLKISPPTIRKKAEDYLKKIERRGVLAITDHNDIRSFADLEAHGGTSGERLKAIRSVEWNSPPHGAHLGVLGVGPDWKAVQSRKESMLRTLGDLVKEARDMGQLRIVNHPSHKGRVWPWREWGDVDAVEVWNGPYPHPKDALLKIYGKRVRNFEAIGQWTSALKAGSRYTAVTGTDFHFPLPMVETFRLMVFPVNIVFSATNTPSDVIPAVKGGRVSLKLTPEAPKLFIRAGWRADQANPRSPLTEMGGSIPGSGKLVVEALADFSDSPRKPRKNCPVGHVPEKPTHELTLLRMGSDQALATLRISSHCDITRWKTEIGIEAGEREALRMEAHELLSVRTLVGLTNPVYVNY